MTPKTKTILHLLIIAGICLVLGFLLWLYIIYLSQMPIGELFGEMTK